MATPFQVNITRDNSGLLKLPLGDEQAAKVSQLLQQDLEKHHVFFNVDGFHDHIAHHLLTLYGTGASSKNLQRAFDGNKTYQLKAMKPSEDILRDLQGDWSSARKYLGKGRLYASFLRFFQLEIEERGWQDTIREYLLKDDDAGRDMVARLFGGLMHPLIQLMYGVEWEQPAIVAEGLAQAAVHDNSLLDFFAKTDAAADSRPSGESMGTIMSLVDRAAKDEKLAASARWGDRNRIRDGVLTRAYGEIIDLAGEVRIEPEELEERTAEMIHSVACIAAGAAFHPPHVPKFDFFLLHDVTAAPFFLTINKQSWIPTPVKVRLLQYKIRVDIVQYLARGSPALHLDALEKYVPQDEAPLAAATTEELLPRFHPIPDDGHTVKLARSLVLAQRESRPYAERPWIQIKDDETWLKAMYLLLDANEHESTKWVRAGGFEEAWEDIPKLA